VAARSPTHAWPARRCRAWGRARGHRDQDDPGHGGAPQPRPGRPAGGGHSDRRHARGRVVGAGVTWPRGPNCMRPVDAPVREPGGRRAVRALDAGPGAPAAPAVGRGDGPSWVPTVLGRPPMRDPVLGPIVPDAARGASAPAERSGDVVAGGSQLGGLHDPWGNGARGRRDASHERIGRQRFGRAKDEARAMPSPPSSVAPPMGGRVPRSWARRVGRSVVAGDPRDRPCFTWNMTVRRRRCGLRCFTWNRGARLRSARAAACPPERRRPSCSGHATCGSSPGLRLPVDKGTPG
jgi:hypothetical protein